jgi:DNA-binding transcriptional MerR regulator
VAWRKLKNIGITVAIAKIGVSAERLRYWEFKRIVSPEYENHGIKRVRRYSQEDIDICMEIKRLVDKEGFTLKGAAKRLDRPYRN